MIDGISVYKTKNYEVKSKNNMFYVLGLNTDYRFYHKSRAIKKANKLEDKHA